MSEYQEKFKLVEPWIVQIIEQVKKDLKHEHLKKDRNFCKRYFLGKNFNLVTVEEMAPAYHKEIVEGNHGLGEFITSRWLLKNSDIYDYFEQELSRINPDFEAIEALDQEESERLMSRSIKLFGHERTYLFALLNSVTFQKEHMDSLREKAIVEKEQSTSEQKVEEEARSREALEKKHEREMRALHNKYDKRISGLEKKYLRDTETLKKQISTLSKKLAEHG